MLVLVTLIHECVNMLGSGLVFYKSGLFQSESGAGK